ncbi:MAG TPA: 16S rRNA (guanine(966)-N(2))-methyltransferase RsmD [Nakamurella sp.]|nr:16S rRNA (guanine(966)-N(2))-methyltransferase RsmD [Nakamurella sp.]
MTRISAGRWRGRRLVTPKGDATRPTAEKVRAAIGNALAATGGLDGSAVLDLYAGSGALGLELASRGAARVVLVERDRAAQAAIRANIEHLAAGSAVLVPGDAAAFARMPGEAFDIVVADPPYTETSEMLATLLADLYRSGRLRPAADVVVERAARDGELAWPEPLVPVRARRYGDTLVCYGRAP